MRAKSIKVVMAYLHFITISFRFDPDYVDMHFEVCRAVLSSGEEQDVSKPDKDLLAAEIAFRQENHGDKGCDRPSSRAGSSLLRRIQLCGLHCTIYGTCWPKWNWKQLRSSRTCLKRTVRCLRQSSRQEFGCIPMSLEDRRYH